MQIKINPTRIELLKLKKRLKVAERGHRLLKEKRDGLMRDFMGVIKEIKEVRVEVESELKEAFWSCVVAASGMSAQTLEEALMLPAAKIDLEVGKKNIMNVKVPTFEIKKEGEPLCYGYLDTVAELDTGIAKINTALERMVYLAQIEKALFKLAREIEKTRRRVNSLEYVLIPDLFATIREIRMKLDEQERGDLIRLQKVKEIIVE